MAFWTRSDFALVAPYAAWMAVLALAPQTAGGYALRTALTGALLVLSFVLLRPRLPKMPVTRRGLAWGLLAGLGVFALWILPGGLLQTPSPSPYAPAVCGWPLTLVKLAGSAFVISVAEELFFRKWLVDFAGFWASVVLFALEHGRWDCGTLAGIAFVAEGAACGIVYGVLAQRCGLVSSMIAHAVTNFVLGLWVVLFGHWQFW